MAPELRCCDIACNAALTRRPSHCGAKICFFSSLAHGDSVSCSHSGDGGAVTSAAHFSLSVSFVHFVCLFSFSQPQCFPCPYRFSMQLPVCDSFLNYSYFSLSFVKEREQRKPSGEAFPFPRSCPSPGSVKPHPGIGYPMPLQCT